MRGWFSELRRRRVLRTAIYYLGGAWVLVEIAATIFPELNFPAHSVRMVIVALAALFPIVLLVSWIFDIDLDGIRKTTGAVEAGAAALLPDEYPATENLGPVHPRSIAVLPFANIGNLPENEFLSDGLADELAMVLGGRSGLKVAARTSSFAFKNQNVDMSVIAARLRVRHVLEGSVRRAGSRVRISVQLIEAENGLHLWSQSFDREVEDIFEIQDQIANAIGDALQTSITDGEAAAPARQEHRPTDSIDAYQIYLRGKYLWARRGADAIRGAIAAFDEAIRLDARFAVAYAGAAAAYSALHEYTGESRDGRERDFAKALPLAHRAIALDADMEEPHAVLGYIHMRRWQWQKSEDAFMEAIARGPNNSLCHQWFSNLLNDVGRQQDALNEARMAYELDRVSPIVNVVLAFNYTLMGQNAGARNHLATAREFGVGGPLAHLVDFVCLLREERFDDAIADHEKSLPEGTASNWVRPLVDAVRDPQRLPDARAALDAARTKGTITRNDRFVFDILLNDADNVFTFADAHTADESLNHTWLFLPEAADLRKDDRFTPLAEKIGLVEYWARHGWPESVRPSA